MTLVGALYEVARLAQDEDLTFLAAAIAYYAFVSLIPALLLVLVVASTIGGERLAGAVVADAGDVLAPAARDLVRDAIRGSAGRAGATVVGVLGLGWSALKVVRGVDTAISRLYGAPRRGLVARIRVAAVAAGAVGIGITAMLAVGGFIAVAASPLGGLVALVLLLVGLGGVFLPLYLVFPPDVTPREALPGTFLAAVGWVTLQAVFQLYAEFAPGFELYGVIGGILLLVTWFYLASILLLVGAAFNVVLADRVNRQVQGRRP